MKKIVLSAITALMVTVGVYHVALLMGASEPAAAFASAAFAVVVVAFVAFAFAVVVAFAALAATAAFTLAAAAAFAFAVVAAFVGVFAFAALAATAAFALAALAAFAAFVAFLVAKQEHLKFKWVFAAYGIEGLAIWGALAVGSPSWSVVIALGGIAALFVLWQAHSHLSALEASSAVEVAPE